MNLFFLAAGEGTRFRPHTQILPKPALPFCGVPLLYQSYFLSRCLNPSRVVINTFHLPNKIHRLGQGLEALGAQVFFSDEQPLLLGSAGGLSKARNWLQGSGDFVALNSDEVIVPTNPLILQDFVAAARRSGALATLMVMKHPEAGKKFGAVWVNSKGQVLGFGKTPPDSSESLTPYHFIGPMYFKDQIFDRLQTEPSNILHDVLKKALQEGEEVGFYSIDCEWFETGNLEDYLKATMAFLKLIKEGNTFVAEFQRDFLQDYEFFTTNSALILKHQTAKISSLQQISGFAVLGAGAEVPPLLKLKNVVLADGAVLRGQDDLHHQLILNTTL